MPLIGLRLERGLARSGGGGVAPNLHSSCIFPSTMYKICLEEAPVDRSTDSATLALCLKARNHSSPRQAHLHGNSGRPFLVHPLAGLCGQPIDFQADRAIWDYYWFRAFATCSSPTLYLLRFPLLIMRNWSGRLRKRIRKEKPGEFPPCEQDQMKTKARNTHLFPRSRPGPMDRLNYQQLNHQGRSSHRR